MRIKTPITKIVTHAGCPDGIISGMLLKLAFPHAEVVPIQYGPARDNLPAEQGMIFCDMSPPEKRVGEFVLAGAYVLDHHKGVEQLVKAFGSRGRYDVNESGASLALAVASTHGFVSTNMQKAARLARVRDLWLTDDPCWREACALGEALKFFGQDYWTGRFDIEPYEIQVGREIVKQTEQHCKKVVDERLFEVHNEHGVRFAITAETPVSDVANAIIEADLADVVVIPLWKQTPDAGPRLVYSYRSRKGEVDVSEICKRWDGGGHQSAAGCSRELDWEFFAGRPYFSWKQRTP